MKIQILKMRKFKVSILYLVTFSISIIYLISLFSYTQARFTATDSASDQARVSQFNVSISSVEASSDVNNELVFNNSTEVQTVNFTIKNVGETAAHVTAVSLDNESGLPTPNYRFYTATNFYLMQNETKFLSMMIFGARNNYFSDTLEELQIQITADQVE